MNNINKKAPVAGQHTQGSIHTGHANASKAIGFTPETIDSGFHSRITSLPQRDWVVDGLCLKKYITAIVAPGGVGKTTFALALGVSVTSNQDFLNLGLKQQTNVLVINNEDDADEMYRRFAGIISYHQVPLKSIENKLFFKSGYDVRFTVTKNEDNAIICHPIVSKITAYIKSKNIGLLIVDPFVSTHNESENDNMAIDKVMSIYRQIASNTGAAIILIHHTRKLGTNEGSAGNADISRGASAFKDAARIVVTLTNMTTQDAQIISFDEKKSNLHFKLNNAKQNFSQKNCTNTWFRMDSCQIPNGEHVGVPTPVNLAPLFSSSNKQVKWDELLVAQSLERIFGNVSDHNWSSLIKKFMSDNQIGNSSSYNALKYLSDNKKSPTIIEVNATDVAYWQTKPPGGSIKIYRKVL